MSSPANMDFAYYGSLGMGCACAYFATAIVATLCLIAWGIGNIADDRVYAVLGIVIGVFLMIPTAVLLRAARKYATWKTWATERGWKEPPKKERAWKAK